MSKREKIGHIVFGLEQKSNAHGTIMLIEDIKGSTLVGLLRSATHIKLGLDL